jgi:hypothetical protein
MPTKTLSPSRISRAAAATINSRAVYIVVQSSMASPVQSSKFRVQGFDDPTLNGTEGATLNLEL